MNSNHLMYCCITYESNEETTLYNCEKSSELFGTPHEIEVIITKNIDKYKK